MTANPHGLVLDPAVQLFLESIDERLDPDERDVAHRDDFASADVDEQVATVDAGEFGSVRVRIVRPSASLAQLPAVVYVPGGDWVAGGARSSARLVADLALGSGVALILPEFTPRAGHPAVLEQAYATASWLSSTGPRWGLDPSRIAAAGDSSGANVAIGLMLLSLWRNDFRFSQLIAFTPVTDTAFESESCHRFADGYFLRRDDLRRCRDRHLPDRRHHTDPTVAPLRADIADLARFPASLIITAEADVVRDQGEAFAARLRDAGAPTTAVRYEGTIHGFVTLDALRGTSASRAALAQAATALRNLLGASQIH